jgi:general nucleoside transport system permease protein
LGMALAVIALMITAVILGNTLFGLRLKAVGSNSKASTLYGMAPNCYFIAAIFISGALAGVAGCLQVSGIYHRLLPAISSGYGYLALLVVMLAGYNVWTVSIIALFFACLNVGSIQLPMVLKVDSSLSGVVQGTLVLSALAMHAWRRKTWTS